MYIKFASSIAGETVKEPPKTVSLKSSLHPIKSSLKNPKNGIINL